MSFIKAAMHRTYECQQLESRNSVQSIVVMVRKDISYCSGQPDRKVPVSIVLITFEQSFAIIEGKKGSLFGKGFVH